jgi:hypothetical protein
MQVKSASWAACETTGEKVFHIATLTIMALIPLTAIVLGFLGFYL